jgi:hypothetical protein
MRRMNALRAIVGIWISVVVAGVAPVSAQTVPAPPAPRIFSVVPNLAGTTLVISGMRFGEEAEVWVDGQLVPVLPGATDERLEIDVPAAWQVQPGTYRLVVRTAAGRTDTFEVMLSGAGSWVATGARPDPRPVGSPTEAGAAAGPGADTVRRAGAAAPGGTRPGMPPSVTEDATSPWATKVGAGALAANSGVYNTAAGYLALSANTTGSNNTAAGSGALLSNTTGGSNTATGVSALRSNSTGSDNTAAGTNALLSNTTGTSNTAAGSGALLSNTTGSQNTAAGTNALFSNTTGTSNTATGDQALNRNTSGSANTAAGHQALVNNTTGFQNTTAGFGALFFSTTGSANTAAGYAVLNNNTTGSYNTADGQQALLGNTTGNRNVALGYLAGSAQTTGSDNVYVANVGVAAEGGTIRIGTTGTHTDTFLAGTVRATAFAGNGAALTNVAATSAATASDLACTGCVAASEVSFNYAGSASAGGPATSALTATTATTATSATTAATASNALALGGLSPSAYAATGHTHVQFGSMLLQGSTGQNTALGTGALAAVSTGTANLALGYQAGNAQTTGSNNVYVANAGVAAESNKIRIGTTGTHTDTYLAGTVRATAFVGDGAGLTNVTCAGSGGSSVPPAAPDSQAVLSELPKLRRIVTAQTDQLAVQGTQLAAQAQQLKAHAQRETTQAQRESAQDQQLRSQAGQLAAQAQQLQTQAQREASQGQLLATLQARLAQIEARLSASRVGGSR